METLEYYQLKDELGKELRDQIQASISSERELQQKYIGLGIKIAIVGLGAAVLAIGIFGIKSAYDLNSAIKSIPARIDRRADSEVQKRFDSSTNPIPKYEGLLRDSAGRSIAASINAQTRNPVRSIVLLDESTSSTIADCLNNCATASTKLLLISALSTTRVRTVNPAIDQGALAVLTNLSADHPINSRGLAQVIQYLSVRSPERFADDIRKVYEVHGDVAQVQSAIAKYLYKLKKDSGKELAEKLAKTGNDNTKLLLHIRDLRNGTVTQPNVALLKHAVESAFDPDDDTMDVDDVVDYMTDINDQGSNPEGAIGSFVDLIREIASSRNLSFAAGNFLAEQDSFFGFAGRSGHDFGIEQRAHFDALFNMAMDHVVNSITNANGEFDDDARKSLAFWLPKAYLDTGIISDRHVGFLLVQRTKKPTFTAENGTLLSTDQFGDPSIVSIENKGGTPVVALKWTDRAGSKTVVITHTSDAHALKAFGTWRSPTEDDIP